MLEGGVSVPCVEECADVFVKVGAGSCKELAIRLCNRQIYLQICSNCGIETWL